MFESLDRLMLATMGAATMTREKAEKIFDEYVARGQAEKENRSGFVKEVMDTAEKARTDMEQLVAKQVKTTMEKLEVATAEDIRRIEGKLDQLLAEKE